MNLEKKPYEEKIANCKQRLVIVTDVIDPVNEKIKQYSSKLYAVVDKYEFKI